MKYLVAVLVLILGIFFFQYRYLAPDAGINARAPDYSNHISIEEHLKEGRLFPELDKSKKGLHAVSKYLPIYHGLLGFHLTSWLLESIGIPLPGAYQLIMDVCLAIYLLFFMSLIYHEFQQERRWELLLAVFTICTIFISNFAGAVEAAFFSQLMSYALCLVGWYLWTKQKKWISIFTFFCAILTYPDFLIWLIPFLVFTKTIRLRLVLRFFLCLVWCVLIGVLYSRRNLVGPEAISVYPLIFLPLLLMLFWSKLRHERNGFFVLLLAYSVVVVGFLFISQSNFTWSYYALKLTYPAVLFLIYVFTKLRLLDNHRGRLLIVLYLVFFWCFADVHFKSITSYFSRSQLIDNRFYSLMKETKKVVETLNDVCDPAHTLVLPDLSDFPPGQGLLRVWARNSLLLNSDMSSVEFKSSLFQQIYDSFNSYEASFNGPSGLDQGRMEFFLKLKNLKSRSQDVCVVSPASTQSLFKDNPCFVILKEEGGQIYAHCQAKAEL